VIRGRPIYLNGNDDEPEHVLTRKAAATGVEEPAAGLTGLTFYLAATPGGAAIHASVSKSATERGVLGVYFAIFEGADLQTQLNSATYKGKDIYQRFGNQADVDFWVIRKVLEFRP
jgi:hypothetical protein